MTTRPRDNTKKGVCGDVSKGVLDGIQGQTASGRVRLYFPQPPIFCENNRRKINYSLRIGNQLRQLCTTENGEEREEEGAKGG